MPTDTDNTKDCTKDCTKDNTNKPMPTTVTHRGDDEMERMIVDKDGRGHIRSDQARRKPADRMKKLNKGHRLTTRYELKSLNAGRGRMRAPIAVDDEMQTELEGAGVDEVDWEGVFGETTRPWRAEVDLGELIIPSKPRKVMGAGDFEMIPRTRNVLAMDDDELMAFYQEAFGDAPTIGAEDEWEWLDRFDTAHATLPALTYAAVVGQG